MKGLNKEKLDFKCDSADAFIATFQSKEEDFVTTFFFSVFHEKDKVRCWNILAKEELAFSYLNLQRVSVFVNT